MKCISRVGFGSALVVVMLAVSPAVSQSFLDRGKDLLKGLGGGSTPDVSSLSVGEIASGLKDAFRVGSERVVSSLSRADGFNKASDVHIPLPGSLKTVQSMLNKVGMGSLTDDLELRLNRGAEAAVTKASKLFGNAIAQMTIEHAKAILNGPKDSATKYFQSKMSGPLMGEMRPIVDSQLSQVGAIASYFKVIGQYKTIPVVPDVKANLTNHVLEKTIAGGFLYLGREEATIRENPSKRTTDLLKKVFAADMSEACLLPSAAADCMVLEAHLQEFPAMNIEDALVQIAIEDTEALIK